MTEFWMYWVKFRVIISKNSVKLKFKLNLFLTVRLKQNLYTFIGHYVTF
jgi:hypothetical protein